jgi:peptide/nickel transport system ATP-binding protein
MTQNVTRLNTLPGLPPDPTNLLPGCCFAPRCLLADAVCMGSQPPICEVEPGHMVACFKVCSKEVIS